MPDSRLQAVAKTPICWNSTYPTWDTAFAPIPVTNALRQVLTIEVKVKTVLKADTVAAVLIDYAAAQRALLEVFEILDLGLI